jgi:sugar lactone lactonase YvrE
VRALLLTIAVSTALSADSGLIATIAGNGSAGTAGIGGLAASAQLTSPGGIGLDSAENLFIVDSGNNRLVRMDAGTGILTLVAGNGAAASSGDGGPAAQASINHPFAVALDAAGNLFISEFNGHRIRRVDAQTGIITTAAGNGAMAWSGDGGPAASASLSMPAGIALDSTGNLYIADQGNDRVRRVDAQTGIITTVAGNGVNGTTADGTSAATASLARPIWVGMDHSGSLLISELTGFRIRRVDSVTGILGTVAGNGDPAFTGDGVPAGSAGIGSPTGMSVDSTGNLFFVDGTGRIRRVDAVTGLISTVAGNGSGAKGTVSAAAGGGGGVGCVTVAGDNGPATNATLEGPIGVQVTQNGNLLVSDWLNCRVRRVHLPSPNPYTNTSLTASATTVQAGQMVIFTANVSGIGTSAVPTGAIQFAYTSIAGPDTVLGAAPLSGGTASLALNNLSASVYQIVAYYSGDTLYNGSGSPAVPLSVTQPAKPVATVTLSSYQNPTAAGVATTFAATVTPPAGATVQASGAVQLYDGLTALAPVTLANGAAQFSVSFTTPGNHTIYATYLGDNNYSQTSSAALNEVVRIAGSVTLTVDSNPSVVGSAVIFTAYVLPSSATGIVTFVGSVAAFSPFNLGSAVLVNGRATLAFSIPSPTRLSVQAVYGGDPVVPGAASAILMQVVTGVPGGLTPVAGIGTAGSAGTGGDAQYAQLNQPVGLYADSANNLFIADYSNNRVARVDANSGVLTAFAGNGQAASLGDGAAAGMASLNGPVGLAMDSSQNLYISEFPGGRIRKVAAQTLVITTIAGNGTHVSSGDGGLATDAGLAGPGGLACDAAGNLYVVERGHSLRRIDAATGIITTLVDTASGRVSNPVWVAVDHSQNLLISDSGFHQILHLDRTTGIITPFAGNGSTTFGGDGMPATSTGMGASDVAVSVDAGGNVFLADLALNRIRRVDAATGIMVTVAGNGTSSPVDSRGLQATAVGLQTPFYVATGSAGYTFFSDSANHVWRINLPTNTSTATSFTVNPANPARGQSITLTANVAPAGGSGVPTGTVSFQQNQPFAGVIGTATLSAGTATLITTAPDSAGSYQLLASYGGDSSFAPSLSPVLTVQVVTAAPTTVTVSSTMNPGLTQTPFGITATVAPSGTSSGQPSGSVQLLEGAVLMGLATLQNGVAQFPVSFNAAGTHLLTAVYAGDAGFAGSTSQPFSEVVKNAFGFASLSSNPNPSTAGAAVTIALVLNQTSATGTVEFLDNSSVPPVSLGIVTVSNGAASLTTSGLSAGSHNIGVNYSGDTNFIGGSSSVSQVVLAASATSLAAGPSAPVYGQAVQLTATVAPDAATGSVTFLDAATVLGTVPLISGVAVLSLPSLSAGAHSIGATYSGEVHYAGSTSPGVAVTVAKATPVIAVTSSQSPAPSSQAVTFTIAFSPASATGSLQLLDGATVLATWSAGNNTVNATLAIGSHAVTAVYGGDSNFVAVTSAVLNQVATTATATSAAADITTPAYGQTVQLSASVVPPPLAGAIRFLDGTTVLATVTMQNGAATLSVASLSVGVHPITAAYSGDGAGFLGSTSAVLTESVGRAATTVTAASSANPSVAGQPVTLSAAVSPAGATGTVQFLDGATSVGVATVGSGAASLTTSALTAGSHSITAVYSGDGNYAASTSAAVTQTVSKAASSVALGSSLNPSTSGQLVMFAATVSPTSATGTVQFLDGATVLGTVALSAGSAVLSTTALSAGSHTITAAYSGNANFNSASSAIPQTVKGLTATSLGSNNASVIFGQTVQFTASVSPGAATGSIQFKDGASLLGTVTVNAGSAVFATFSLAVGTHSITAAYSGDGGNIASTSAVFAETVTAPPPGAPSTLSATTISSSQIGLSWTASPTSGVTYNVYSGTVSGFTPATSNRIAAGVTATTYSHVGLSPSTTHYYVVTAQSSAGESVLSNQAAATTQASGPGCHVAYTVTGQWNDGFEAAITIKNTGSTPINGWSLDWTWAANQQITESWNSADKQKGHNATLTNLGWNKSIAAGATLTGMGFNASYSGTNTAPTAFSVNGTLCH